MKICSNITLEIPNRYNYNECLIFIHKLYSNLYTDYKNIKIHLVDTSRVILN